MAELLTLLIENMGGRFGRVRDVEKAWTSDVAAERTNHTARTESVANRMIDRSTSLDVKDMLRWGNIPAPESEPLVESMVGWARQEPAT